MQQVHYALGLDVDKATFKACLKVKEPSNKSTIRGTKTFPNSTQGFKDLESWIKKHKKFDEAELKIIMEATGVYHEHLAWYLHQGNFQVYIMLPLRAKRYLQSLGVKSKNDKIDAQGLADMGLQQELNQWKPCSKNILVLRSLTRQLQMLQESRTSFRNQLESATHLANCDRMVIRNLKSLIKAIEKDIENLKKRIEQFVAEDEVLFRKYKLVEPIKGIGITTFATLVAETGGFGLFESQKQLVSYAGYN
jgi:transposase